MAMTCERGAELSRQVDTRLSTVLPIGLTPNAPMGSVAKWAGPIFPSP
jgi:hypothetical protein